MMGRSISSSEKRSQPLDMNVLLQHHLHINLHVKPGGSWGLILFMELSSVAAYCDADPSLIRKVMRFFFVVTRAVVDVIRV